MVNLVAVVEDSIPKEMADAPEDATDSVLRLATDAVAYSPAVTHVVDTRKTVLAVPLAVVTLVSMATTVVRAPTSPALALVAVHSVSSTTVARAQASTHVPAVAPPFAQAPL